MRQTASCDSPIFVVGSSRSGTTMLYSILLTSGEFPIYEAETLLLSVCPVKYGNIKKDKNYERFINDWIQSKQFLRSRLDPEEFKRDAKNHHSTYSEFLMFFMECMASKQGKSRWVEKTPGHIKYMDQLSKAFANAKFIHVIRDGRDVALSKRKAGWIGTKSKDPIKQLLIAAIDWETSLKYGRAYRKKLGNNYLEIYYEDMICDLDNALERINDFSNTRIEKHKIENNSIGSLKNVNTAFNDKMEGISNKALLRWKKELTEEELRTLNIAVGETLLQFGYNVDDFKVLRKSFSYLKIKSKKTIYKFFIYFKTFLKQKMPVGRFVASGLEISQVRAEK
jgi:hypothetical protein